MKMGMNFERVLSTAFTIAAVSVAVSLELTSRVLQFEQCKSN